MQVRAIFEAACELSARGVDAQPDVMIPGVGTIEEMQVTHDATKAVADEVIAAHGGSREVPHRDDGRAAARLRRRRRPGRRSRSSSASAPTTSPRRSTATRAMTPRPASSRATWRRRSSSDDPFQVLDRVGVGELMRMGVERGRTARPNLKIGICGEHGGEPSSVAFCDELGLDYVSCSPYRVPIARLAAAQSALGG
jgi:pyruvate,orthophosphate dikinase